MKKNYASDLASLFEKTATSNQFSNLSIEEMESHFLSSAKPVPQIEKRAHTLPVESVDVADKWGRELAHELFEKTALGFPVVPGARAAAGAMGTARRAVGSGMNYAMNASTMNRMGVGAAIGGVMGGMRSPGLDPSTGQPRSRMGGAMMGAATGGLAGYAAKGGATALASNKGAVGNYVNNAASSVKR